MATGEETFPAERVERASKRLRKEDRIATGEADISANAFGKLSITDDAREAQDILGNLFNRQIPAEKPNVKCDDKPCSHVLVRQFTNSLDLECWRNILLRLPYDDRNTDLFNFQQTKDLKSVPHPAIKELCRFFSQDVNAWLEKALGTQLDAINVDVSGSIYRYTDFLTCHDDRLDTRKFAFMWYLVDKEWNEYDGGALEFLESAEKQDETKPDQRVPGVVGKRIYPAPNQFVMFEVSSKSFHQVSEILSTSKTRLSVNGWFHLLDNDGKRHNGGTSSCCGANGNHKHDSSHITNVAALPAPAVPSLFEDASTWTRLTLDGGESSDMLNQYFNAAVLKNAAEQMEEFSEQGHTAIEQFLKPQLNSSLYQSLRDDDMSNKINWHVPDDSHRSGYWHYVSLTDVNRFHDSEAAQTLAKIFLDPKFFQWLQTSTGFSLIHLDVADGASSSSSVGAGNGSVLAPVLRLERWEHGDYSLLTSTMDFQQYRLDCYYFLLDERGSGCAQVPEQAGGFVSFIDQESGDEVHRIVPTNNTLFAVVAESEVCRFTRFINDRYAFLFNGSTTPIYRLVMSYKDAENPNADMEVDGNGLAAGDDDDDADEDDIDDDDDDDADENGDEGVEAVEAAAQPSGQEGA